MKERSLFVVGDSVSIHYGPYLKRMVEDKFNYDRKRGEKQALVDLDKPVGANAGDSRMILDYFKELQQENFKFDVLLFNCGLHDIRVDRVTKETQVSAAEYRANLEKIIMIAKGLVNQILWVSSTPVIDDIHNRREAGFLRYEKDVRTYNEIASEIMLENHISIIDLFTFTKSLGTDIYCDHVHYKEEIRKLQADFIASYLFTL